MHNTTNKTTTTHKNKTKQQNQQNNNKNNNNQNHKNQTNQFGTPLARVFDTSDLRVKFAVPRDHVNDVRPGQRVELTFEGKSRPLWAVISSKAEAQEPPINFTVVEAEIDDTRLTPGELRVAAVARVRIADARGAKR